MIRHYHRFTLAILLAVALFCITAHFATPTACCAPTGSTGCGCQTATNGNTDSGIDLCLACMIETGIRFQQSTQVTLQEVINAKPLEGLLEAPVEATFGLFRPPISQL